MTQRLIQMLTGNLLSIGIGGIITMAWSYGRPQNFDWEITRRINVSTEPTQITRLSAGSPAVGSLNEGEASSPGIEKEKSEAASFPTPIIAVDGEEIESNSLEAIQERTELAKAFRFAAWSAVVLTVILILIIPLSLFFSQYGE